MSGKKKLDLRGVSLYTLCKRG